MVNEHETVQPNENLTPIKVEKNIASREGLTKKMRMHGFAMAEAALFLDTHPDDTEALRYFKKHQKELNEASMEYADKYDPISKNHMGDITSWTWVKNPWPWEGEAF